MNILSKKLSTIDIEENIVKIPIYVEIETDSLYKYEEMTTNGKVLRNNNDPTLTPDGLPTIETQLENIKKLDEETLLTNEDVQYNNIRLKCLILHSMGKSILQDTRFLKTVDKEKYNEIKEKLLEELTQEELTNKFNKICQQTIFECGEDMSKYPIYV
jgi:hypothetical protein